MLLSNPRSEHLSADQNDQIESVTGRDGRNSFQSLKYWMIKRWRYQDKAASADNYEFRTLSLNVTEIQKSQDVYLVHSIHWVIIIGWCRPATVICSKHPIIAHDQSLADMGTQSVPKSMHKCDNLSTSDSRRDIVTHWRHGKANFMCQLMSTGDSKSSGCVIAMGSGVLIFQWFWFCIMMIFCNLNEMGFIFDG